MYSLSFKFISLDAIPNAIYPSLHVQVNGNAQGLQSNEYVYLENVKVELYIVTEKGVEVFLTSGEADQGLYYLYSNDSGIRFKVNLDYFGVSQIETIRGNNKLRVRAKVRFTHESSSGSQRKQPAEQTVEGYVEKSYWVEDILSRFNYKEVFLLEIPKLLNKPETKDIQKHLTDATNKFINGDSHGTISSCYLALEATKAFLKKQGLTHEVTRDTNTYEEPDFAKFTDSGSIKTSLEKSWSGLWGFPQSGARHIGKDREPEEAHFQLLSTYGIINLILRNLT